MYVSLCECGCRRRHVDRGCMGWGGGGGMGVGRETLRESVFLNKVLVIH